ncbi:patatin-like phospholipase family protein [Candidatus Dojkabacteria bacterium]|nr:patatin-like phospholipase family protein [Candidatus Dojkabacteria bacterium]
MENTRTHKKRKHLFLTIIRNIRKRFSQRRGKKSLPRYDGRYFNILSIDGGGVLGIFPSTILMLIEQEFKVDLSKFFQLVAGTSTGSIITTGISIKYPVADMVELYESRSASIFKSDEIFRLIAKSKYSEKNLQKLIDEIFKKKTVFDTYTDILVPSINVTKGEPVVFSKDDVNTKLRDVVLASCSVPVYFPPHKIKKHLFIDGGLWMNNPSTLAISEALIRYKRRARDIRVLSFGTGNQKYDYEKALGNINKDDNWGALRWKNSLIPLLISMPTLGNHHVLESLLPSSRYIRLNYEYDKPLYLDDAKVVPNIKKIAYEYFDREYSRLKNFFTAD